MFISPSPLSFVADPTEDLVIRPVTHANNNMVTHADIDIVIVIVTRHTLKHIVR